MTGGMMTLKNRGGACQGFNGVADHQPCNRPALAGPMLVIVNPGLLATARLVPLSRH